MRQKIDLTGQQFGKWTVIEEIPERKNGKIYWRCKCECGNEKNVYGYWLRKGISKSCGCLQKEIASKTHLINLTQQKFGNLTVLQKAGNIENTGEAIWKCQCDCGKIIFVPGYRLRAGQNSCGCLNSSNGVIKIIELLNKNNIPFETEKYFSDCKDMNSLPFDFYINNQYIIEFDGIQHFEPIEYFGGEKEFQKRQKHDQIKNEYCKKNNISLIRIPYNHLNNLCLEDLLLETSSFIIN